MPRTNAKSGLSENSTISSNFFHKTKEERKTRQESIAISSLEIDKISPSNKVFRFTFIGKVLAMIIPAESRRLETKLIAALFC